MKIERFDFSEFFKTHLDLYKDDVADWGAFTGYHGRPKEPALRRVTQLARAAVARAGFGSPARLAQAQQRLKDIETTRTSIRSRFLVALARLTGTASFSSPGLFRNVMEGTVDFLVIPLLPLALVALWPPAAWARRDFRQVELQDGVVAYLAKEAENYLTLVFETYFEKGEEARKRGQP